MAIDNKVFCKMWAKSASVAEVAEALEMTTTNATARAAMLRKAGVLLKSFPRGRKAGSGLDVAALNAMLAGDDGDEPEAPTAPEAPADEPEAPAAPVKGKKGKKPVKLVVPEDDGDDDD